MSIRNIVMAEGIRNIAGKFGIKTAVLLEGGCTGERVFWKDGERIESIEGYSSVWESLQSHFDEITNNQIIFTEEGKIFVESINSQPKMVICGGGHISIPLIKVANLLEFEVTVLEDRPLFANNARKAGASSVICESFEESLEKIQGDASTYFVIVTRGHRYDTLCLEQILKKEYAYVGMIGSRARVAKVKELMLEKGFKKDILDSIYSPIGLKIKAETPVEIAISILAEIIRHKNERQSGCGYTKEIMQYFTEEWTKEIAYAMVTIISRTGSAPRGVGTKMVVQEDGRMIGTIGGGCMEASIRTTALEAIREGKTQITCVDLTEKEAEEEGMVCGGSVEILIEG